MSNNPAKMRIAFIGDISLNDDYIDLYRKGMNPFKNVQPVLLANGYVIGNLECMAKGEKGENLAKKPRLTTSVETLNYLKILNVKLVSLAHNHVYDHLLDGFLKTVNFLDDNNILHLGAGLSPDEAAKPQILTKDKIKIGLLNYITLDTNPNLPKDADVFLNYFTLNQAQTDIDSIKDKVDHIVLLLHWGGNVEGGLFPDYEQPKIARKLIDAGADLIIGHHSHTIQPYEIYKGKYIFYSLGNFCFSDFAFEGESIVLPLRRRIGMVINVNFYTDSYSMSLFFFRNDKSNYKPNLNYLLKLKLLNFIHNKILKYLVFWNIYFFHKQNILPLISFIKRRDLSLYSKSKRLYKSVYKRYISHIG